MEIKKTEYKTRFIWLQVMYQLFVHLGSLYAVYLGFSAANWKTALFAFSYAHIGGFGVTAGAHRLWSHRSYKAKMPLRVLLCCLYSIPGQEDLFIWCRDHRAHHKFADTDADPYNAKRGFFFAHIGWFMSEKHPDYIKKLKSVFIDDLLIDPVVRFHTRFYYPMFMFFCIILPTLIPVWCWCETIWNSFFIAAISVHCYIQNMASFVNSVGHKFGDQPYDKGLEARENALVAIVTIGEGWHNYHHTYPWDYSASELGYKFNITTMFIDFMAFIGQAYDLKYAHSKMVQKRKLKTGDGTRRNQIREQENYSFCMQS